MRVCGIFAMLECSNFFLLLSCGFISHKNLRIGVGCKTKQIYIYIYLYVESASHSPISIIFVSNLIGVSGSILVSIDHSLKSLVELVKERARYIGFFYVRSYVVVVVVSLMVIVCLQTDITN